jgi:hypothetical protein
MNQTQINIGDIFENKYPPEAASFCEENKCAIKELERTEEGKRQFQIVKLSQDIPSDIQVLQHLAYLSSTDWLVIRKQETGAEIPEEITRLRQIARNEISALRELTQNKEP